MTATRNEMQELQEAEAELARYYLRTNNNDGGEGGGVLERRIAKLRKSLGIKSTVGKTAAVNQLVKAALNVLDCEQLTANERATAEQVYALASKIETGDCM